MSNTFSGFAEGAALTVGGIPFHITYKGGSGNDVVLTRVRPVSTITYVVVAGTNVQFQILGLAGFPSIVEASTNLVNCQAISTNTPCANGVFAFVDTDRRLFSKRFFRVLTP